MKLPFLSAVRLQVTLTDRSTNNKETKDLEVVSGEQIPVDLSDKIAITKEGEVPTRIVPSPQGFMVEWADGTLVFLTPNEDVTGDQIPRQVSINDATFSGGDGDLNSFMNWQASYEDSPLPWAPLDPYAVPLPESEIEVPLVPGTLEPEPVPEPVPVITPAFAAPVIAPPPPDTVPTIGPLSGTGVDEEGLAVFFGNPGGEGDLAGEDTVKSGTFENFSYGDNGPGDVELVASTDTGLRTIGGYVVYSEWDGVNHVLTGFADINALKVPIFTLTLTEDASGVPTGEWTFELLRQIQHDAPGPGEESFEDDKLLNVNVIVSDADGDSVSATFTVTIDDDSPEISPAQQREAPSLVVDESVLPASDSVDLTPQFSWLPGVDSPFDLNFALGVSSPGVDSTFDDTLTGDSIFLFLNGSGNVEGRVGVDPASAEVSGIVAFTLSLDSNTHVLTLEQTRAIVHPDGSNPDDVLHLPDAAVIAIATITDVDGDSRSASINIGDALVFADDGPSIQLVGESQMPTLATDDTDIADSAGPVSFASLFDGVFGNDSYKDSDDNDIEDADAISYALGVKEANANSGVVDTLTGDAVLLNMDGADVVGTVNGGATEVFRITVDENTGEVSLIQSRSVEHDDPLDPEEAGSPAMLSGADLITLTATIEDGDGDTDTATANIGNAFAFEDDGPSIDFAEAQVPTLTTDDTNITDSAGPVSFASLFTSAFGTDGYKDSDDNDVEDDDAISYALGVTGGPDADSNVVDTLTGDAVLLNMDGTDVVGTVNGGATEVFRITVDENTGEVSLIQSRSVEHDDDSDPEEAGGSAVTMAAGLITLTATIEDGDGDTDTATANIGNAFTFEDDGPSIDLAEAQVPTLTTDDTNITDSAGPVSFASLFTSAFGTDGYKDSDDNDVEDDDAISYALGVTGGPDADSNVVDTLTGDTVLLNVVGGDVVGTVNGGATEVFRITVDENTGEVSLIQSRSVEHDDDSDPEEAGGSAVTMAAGLITLTATIEDGDGDTDTATANIGNAFTFEDDGPSIDLAEAQVPTLTTDDTDIADSAGPVSFASLFTSAFGTDGYKDSDDNDVEDDDAISYALGVTGGPDADSNVVDTLTGDAVLLNMDGTDVVGTVNGGATEVFRITVDENTGEVSLIQSRSVEHDDDSDPEEAGGSAVTMAAGLITLTATIEDGDGDTDTATANIGNAFTFEDDGPSIDLAEAQVPTLRTDDTDIADSAGPVSFASLFTSAFGTDGYKDSDDNDVEDDDAISYALGVKEANANSGVVDTLTGDAVLLNMDGADVVGTVNGGATEVFRITVDENTGEVSLIQSRSVEHDDPLDPEEAGGPAVLSGADLITLTATIEDGDGDTDTATANIGNAFTFEDDGPSIDSNEAVVPTLMVDETIFATNASASFAGLFDADFYNDGPKDEDDNDIEDGDAISYELGISGPGANSGLVDTLTDEVVTLSVNAEGTVVTGSSATGGTVFTITVDAETGLVTLDQVRAVQHGDPTDPDEADTPAVLAATPNLITLTATITDGDLDTDSATRDITGAFTFEDDGPSIDLAEAQVPTLTTDDTNITDSAGPVSFASLFTSAFGTDGYKDSDDNDVEDDDAISYALGVTGGPDADSNVVDTLTGDTVLLNVVGGDVVGTVNGGATEVFRITVDENTGEVSLIQSRSVEHDDDSDPEEAGGSAVTMAAGLITLTATIEDGDGDTDTATANIGNAFAFEDDGPSIDLAEAQVPTLTTDDTNITDSAGPVSFASLFTSAFGTDGSKDSDDNDVEDDDAISYALGVTGGPDADSNVVDTLTGDAVLLNMDGTDVVGTVNGGATEVFRITVDENTGEVSLIQSRSVEHDDDSDPEEAGGSAVTMAAGLITLTATIEDGDGDTDTATANIGNAFTFEDDGPSIDLAEAQVPTLTTDDTNITDSAGPVSFASLFTSAFGTDGYKDSDDNDVEDDDAISYALGVKEANANSGVVDTLTGDAVLLNMDGTDVVGTVNGGATEVFRITVDENTGEVSLIQSRSVEHDDDSDPEEAGGSAVTMAAGLITLTATIEDGDGDTDTATANIGNAFTFEDDGPSIDLAEAQVPTLTTDDTNIADSAGPVSFASLFTSAFGTDGYKDSDDNDVEDDDAISYALGVTGGPDADSNVVDTLTGDTVLLNVVGGDVVGTVNGGATEVFRITVDENTGEVSLIQSRSVEHDDDSDPEEAGGSAVTMAAGLITLTATIEDGDGDTDTATANIGNAFAFEDDGPSVSTNLAVLLDDDALAGGNVGGTGDNANADNLSGTLAHTFGEDGGSIAWLTTGAPDGFSYEASGDDLLVKQGTTTVLIATLDTATGAYTVSQEAPILHESGLDENNQVFTLNYRVTDGDEDTADGVLTINVDDDTPTASSMIDSDILDDEGLAGGVIGGTADAAGVLLTTSGNLGYSVGADDLGTLVLSGPATLGTEAVTSSWDSLTNKLTISSVRGALMTVEVTNLATGAYTATLLMPLMHPTVSTEDNITLNLGYTITDKDGDSAIGSLQLTIDDDSPAIVTPPEAIELELVGSDLTGTGDFEYNIGADQRDSYSASNSDFSAINLAGTVGANAITTPVVEWVSENDSTAVYNVSFEYQSDPGDPSETGTATGTLTFDKAAGTYTVTLNPIEGFQIVDTANAQGFTGYDLDGGQDDVMVAKLDDDFYVQFTGNKGTNPVPLGTVLAPGDDYDNGEVFSAAQTTVVASSVAVGVGGNQINSGDLLDMDFFTTDPGSNINLTPTGRASGIFLHFDHVGTEDIVVLLKLIDPDDNSLTTRALVVDSGDFFTSLNQPPAAYGTVLAGDDGFVIIESNDYNTGTENYQIYGAQVMTSTEGVTGTGIDFVKDTGDGGASTTYQEFAGTPGNTNPEAATDDQDGMKILNIGFIAITSASLPADLDFSFTVVDADGDASATQTLDVTIGATPVVLDMDHNGLEFTSLADSQAHFDFNGDGVMEHSAWIGAHDAFLAYDANGDGKVNNGSEISFTQYSPDAHTDLEGLRLAFDTNHDNMLSADDADYSRFGLWMDADGDGVTDSGEYQSLADAGIVNIGLTSDGQDYLAADGDVMVFGESGYTHADGSTGTVGDVALATEPIASDSTLPAVSEVLSTGDALDAAMSSLAENATDTSGESNTGAVMDSGSSGDTSSATSESTAVADASTSSSTDMDAASSVPESVVPVEEPPPVIVA